MAYNVKINGVTYSSVPSVSIPLATGSGSAVFYDTSAATADAANILSGQTAYGATGALTGAMTNNGAVTGTISAVAGEYTVPAGYHSGSGTVAIDSADQALLISENIKSGVTILGVAGSTNVVNTAITSNAATAAQIVSGYTAYVNGALITGTLTSAVISQDSTSKVLSIS